MKAAIARWLGRGLAVALFSALSLSAAVARAQPAQPAQRGRCAPTGPWVLVTVREPRPPALQVGEVLERLGVELGMRGITLCEAAPVAPKGPPVASVTFTRAAAPPGAVSVEIEARKGAAKKLKSRAIDLSAIPGDRAPTVVALGADELMRAAWEELALEPEPPPPPPAPAPAPTPPASGADASAPPLRTRRTLALGVRGSAELWTGGLTLFGADGGASLRVTPRTRIELHAGARSALDDQADNGAVEAQALCVRAGASVALTGADAPAELALGARVGGYAVRMSGEPDAGATSGAATSGALTLEAGPSLTVPFGASGSAVVLDTTVAAALRGVSARDGHRVVTGLTGFAMTTSIGVVAGVL